MVTLVRLPQELKAKFPMLVTLLGRVTSHQFGNIGIERLVSDAGDSAGNDVGAGFARWIINEYSL